MRVQLYTLTLTAAVALALTGCASTGYQKADKTGENIALYRDELVKGKAAVSATGASLDRLTKTATDDPRPAFAAFTKDIKAVQSVAERAKARAEAMRAGGDAYFQQWQKQLESVTNPEVRALAEKRRTELMATYSKINGVQQGAKANYQKWLSDILDLEKLLGNDLTVQGIDAAKSFIDATRADGDKLDKSLNDLIAELNTVAATVTPAKTPKK